jgi:hypothetical protein
MMLATLFLFATLSSPPTSAGEEMPMRVKTTIKEPGWQFSRLRKPKENMLAIDGLLAVNRGRETAIRIFAYDWPEDSIYKRAEKIGVAAKKRGARFIRAAFAPDHSSVTILLRTRPAAGAPEREIMIAVTRMAGLSEDGFTEAIGVWPRRNAKASKASFESAVAHATIKARPKS